MPVRVPRLDEWRQVRTIGEGAQGKITLMERRSDGKLEVRKQTHSYKMLNDRPLEPYILQNVLPSSRRLIALKTFSFQPVRHQHDNLIEWFEYCKGKDLQRAVRNYNRLSEDFIWHCFVQIAEALDVVHNGGSRRVFHRDIKPDNIFLEKKYRHAAPWPNLKLGDFGVAVLREHSSADHEYRWQGPEMPIYTTASDIWGLGAIIHWLAHGRPPIAPRPTDFRGTREEWESQPRARNPIPLPNTYSSDLNRYMMSCLKWQPGERISSQVLVHHLRRDRPRPRR